MLFRNAACVVLTFFFVWNPLNINCSPRKREEISDKSSQGKPNVIFIVIDDMGFNDAGWHNEDIYSPNLNELAMNGIKLNRSYMLPSCSPSRSAMMTGVYPFRSGMQGEVLQSTYPVGLPLKYNTLADEFKNQGYATHIIGKWNLGFCHWNYTPTFRGFDSFFGFYQPAERFYTHLSYVNASETQGRHGYDFRNNTEVAWDYCGVHNSIPFIKQAKHIMKTHDPSKPFFLYFPTPYIHTPHEIPCKYDEIYKNSPVKNIFRRGCMARVSALDDQIKELMDLLKTYNLYENSVIAVTSDNGASVFSGGNNQPLRGGKMTLYEGGTRVPGFFFSPNRKYIKKSYVYDGMMHAVDWLPTLLGIIGGETESEIDGVNMWPAITGNKPSPRTEFFYNIANDGGNISAAMRKGKWKLIVGKAGIPQGWYTPEETRGDFSDSYYDYKNIETDKTNSSSIQLYNLDDDPSERVDLSATNPSKVRELMELIVRESLQSIPVRQKNEDPAGDPALFGGAFTPGWCSPIFDPKENVRQIH